MFVLGQRRSSQAAAELTRSSLVAPKLTRAGGLAYCGLLVCGTHNVEMDELMGKMKRRKRRFLDANYYECTRGYRMLKPISLGYRALVVVCSH